MPALLIKAICMKGSILVRICMLESSFLKKALVCAAAILILGGCAQNRTIEAGRIQKILRSCRIIPEPGVESRETESPSQSNTDKLEKVRQDLDFYEKEVLEGDAALHAVALRKLVRACFLAGQLENRGEKEKYFEKGQTYSQMLCREQPERVEGHYWLAMNLAGIAEVGGAGRGLRLIPTIVDRMEQALAIDETYDQAGPHRVLGCIFCKAPSWPLSEGDISKSVQHLRAAVKIAPQNSTNHLYYAEALIEEGKNDEAYRELEHVLKATRNTISAQNLESDRQKALCMMHGIKE